MAGQRMLMPGMAEVSGVATWEDCRGRGYARALIGHVLPAMVARGEQPFLPSYADNAGAIALPDSLGFRLRRQVHVLVIARLSTDAPHRPRWCPSRRAVFPRPPCAAAVRPARAMRALETIMEEDHPQYGLIGQMIAQPGQRGALAAILTEGTDAMPGNFAYIVGEDAENPDALWIVELWADKAAHAASLQLPAVQAAIAKGRPLIAGFGSRAEFKPVAKAGA